MTHEPAGGQRGAAAESDPASAEQVEAIMAAARALQGMTAASIARLNDVVTVAQLRILVMLSTQGRLNLGAVATALGVHASNATRTVDRLVKAGLLRRRDSPADRRQLELTLTERGAALVASVIADREAWARKVLSGMPPRHRSALVGVLGSFVEAAGATDIDDPWPALGASPGSFA